MLMAKLLRLRPVAAALLLSLTLNACAGGTRRPPLFGKRHKPVNGVSPTLKVATRDELSAIIARTYYAIQSFQATGVDLAASKGGVYEGATFDYPAVSGVILFRKPNSIRVHATYSALNVLLFDMVSDGTNFRIYLPKANPNPLFMAGLDSAPATSASKMENFRPEAFLSSMLIRPWDPATESIMLKDDTD
jgi:outer membrane lipoprotein-sorting protein